MPPSQDGRLHQLVLRHVAFIATRLVDVGRSESPALAGPVLCRVAKAPLCAAYRQELAQLPLAPARLRFLHSRCSSWPSCHGLQGSTATWRPRAAAAAHTVRLRCVDRTRAPASVLAFFGL